MSRRRLKDEVLKRALELSSADVVFLYLATSANERVKPKLEAALEKGS